jgi:hypothetical protein
MIAGGQPARAWASLVVYGDGSATMPSFAETSQVRAVTRAGWLSGLGLAIAAALMAGRRTTL